MAAICLAKVSILLLLEELAVSRPQKRFTLATAGVVGICAVVGIVVLAVQCGSSNPWAFSPPKCINMKSYWIDMAVFDVITRLVRYQRPRTHDDSCSSCHIQKRPSSFAAFIFRVLSIAATITRLFYIHPATARVPDATIEAVSYNIVTQCVLSIGITIACIPCLKPSSTASSPILWLFPSKTTCLAARIRTPAIWSTRWVTSRTLTMDPEARATWMPRATRPQNYEKDNISGSEESDYDLRNKMGTSVHVVADGQSHEQ